MISFLCGTSFPYLEQRHLSGLLNEQMQFINLLPNKWWDRVTASNDTLAFSAERGGKFSVFKGVFMAAMLGIGIQRMCNSKDITTILTVTEQDKSD